MSLGIGRRNDQSRKLSVIAEAAMSYSCEGGVGQGECGGEISVLVRHTVRPLQRASEEQQAVVSPSSVHIQRFTNRIDYQGENSYWNETGLETTELKRTELIFFKLSGSNFTKACKKAPDWKIFSNRQL